ncbi:hypothetical protein [Flavobacterium geliluteum]|uniref:Lipoprotein n=1 Tax=Flavobacterium geliluteum TaxID=2816120 RepID=A0A940XDR4_9FLAO|nr:hypothetical protein [Flavobacterium geliluteum]MBP4140061.1 hypothetical protein [Flavobacterium geliluteum]
MKKRILILYISLQLTSCTFPSYVFQERKMQTGLDFTSGKWLLNTVDAPYNVNAKLTQIIIKDFTQHLDTRLNYVPKTKGLFLPQNTPFNPTKKEIKNLKIGTNFDYFINVKALKSKQNLGAIDITPHRFRNESETSVIVQIEIYDLNNEEIIYSETVEGSVAISNNNNNDIIFSKSADGLIFGAYKRIKKDINKKSI